MSKELEALENMKNGADEWYRSYEMHEDYPMIKQSLQRLEAIDNAKPSEALECWNWLNATIPQWCREKDKDNQDTLIPIKQYILKSQEQEKVLKVLFEKNVDIEYIKTCFYDEKGGLKEYNSWVGHDEDKELTQEEFDLLKRYLDKEKGVEEDV